MSRRVLVARLDSMGDVLLSGPAVRAVARKAEVVFLSGPRGAEAAQLLPGISQHIVWNAPWISTAAAVPLGPKYSEHIEVLLREVTEARVDEAVILTSFHQSPLPLALLLRQAGVARISGASVDTPGSLLDVRLIPGENLVEEIPEPLRALAIAAAAGFDGVDDDRLSVEGITAPPAELRDTPYVVLHPGADAPSRMWTLDGFSELARLLHADGFTVVLTGTRSERRLTAAITREAPHAIDLAGQCSLAELGSVLAAAQALVAGNTGPAHLAAAVRTPVVSLFSPVVSPAKWAPFGVPVRLLGDQSAPCRATRARECPVPGHPCLARVSARSVLRAIHDLVPNVALSGKELAR